MRRDCPAEFQERINATFGTNQYGEPIFRLGWGQSEMMRAGGYWEKTGFHGYKDIYVSGGTPCWCIMMWEPAEKFGGPGLWYAIHRDEATGMQDLGKYPYHGRYRLIHKLIHREMVMGHLVTEAMELNTMIIDAILPMCKAWQSLEEDVKIAALRLHQQIEDEEAAKAAAEAKASYAPAFRGATVSYTGQGCRTSLIAKKEEFLERNFKLLMAKSKAFGTGFRQVTKLHGA